MRQFTVGKSGLGYRSRFFYYLPGKGGVVLEEGFAWVVSNS